MNPHEPIDLTTAEAADAPAVVEVIHAAFGARPAIAPPPPALSETAESVAVAIGTDSGILAWIGDRLAGVILLGNRGHGRTVLQRVAVHPDFQGRGVATAMVSAVQQYAADLGYRSAEIFVRDEFPALRQWWERNGYGDPVELGHGHVLYSALPLVAKISSGQAMQDLGRRLAGHLHAGDVLILDGELGAGKTTLTQGIGAGLGVEGPVVSPTFVLSRVHRPADTEHGPALVHVDGYRLGGADELDDIDLDASLATSVTVVEWGTGIAEGLAGSRLEISIDRSGADDSRTVYLHPVGIRWDDRAISGLEDVLRAERTRHDWLDR